MVFEKRTGKVADNETRAHFGDNLFCHCWPLGETKSNDHEGICFINIDLAGATAIRDYIEKQCEKLGFNENQVFEISLISDELVANAIVATALKEKSETIVYRWRYKEKSLSISVLDYGGGLDLPKVYREIPAGDTFEEFIDELKIYKNKSIVEVKNHGKLIKHTRFGRGLRIVSGLADSVGIKFHQENGVVTKTLEEGTIGTIITVNYQID